MVLWFTNFDVFSKQTNHQVLFNQEYLDISHGGFLEHQNKQLVVLSTQLKYFFAII